MRFKAFTLSILLLLGLSVISSVPTLAEDEHPGPPKPPNMPYLGVWILSPSNGSVFSQTETVAVEGLAVLEEMRWFNLSYYAWKLDGTVVYEQSGYFDGFIHDFHDFTNLSLGDHNITFVANMTWYGEKNDTITITIVEAPANPAPDVIILSPLDGANFTEGESIIVVAHASDDTDYMTGYRWKLDGGVVDEELGLDLGTVITKSYVFSGLAIGYHSVIFEAIDNQDVAGSDAIVIEILQYIPPNIPPVADFFYYNTTDTFFYFNDTSTDEDGTVVAWEWDFESDGTVDSTDQYTSHNFTSDGDYNVKLTVADNYNVKDSVTKTIIVGNQPPVANAGVDRTVEIGDTVNFTGKGTDSDGTIVKYEWDFDGNGAYDWTGTESGNATYTYDDVGFYYATLRVTDEDGATDTDVAIITVTFIGNKAPTANAGHGQIVDVHEVVVFIGVGEDPDGDIVLYEWDFEDDGVYDWSSDSSGVASYIYHTAGTFHARFRVTDNLGLNDTDTVLIRVRGPSVESERLRMSYDFRFYGLRVERIYEYDNKTAVTKYTLRITNLLDERRMLLIRETIPENITEKIGDVNISVVPDWIYNREDPIEIGWNVTLNSYEFFEVNFTFYKYIDSERFEEMEKPRITEFEETDEGVTEQEFESAGVGITGYVFGVFANPWFGLVAVVIIASLAISFWRRDEVLMAWEGFKIRVDNFIRKLKEI